MRNTFDGLQKGRAIAMPLRLGRGLIVVALVVGALHLVACASRPAPGTLLGPLTDSAPPMSTSSSGTLVGELAGVGTEDESGSDMVPITRYTVTIHWRSSTGRAQTDMLLTPSTQVSLAGKSLVATSPVTVETELNRYLGVGGASRVRATYEASSGAGSSNTDPPYTYPVLTKLEVGAF